MRLGLVVLALGVGVACSDGDSDTDESAAGPSGPARVEMDCAPDDGAAFELTLGLVSAACEADVTGEYDLRISVWSGLPEGPGTVSFTSADGQVFYTPAGESDRIEGDHSGEITFSRWDDTAIEGSYHVDFADGTAMEGTFEAPALCDDGTMCG